MDDKTATIAQGKVELDSLCKRRIKEMEKDLDKTFRKAWIYTNNLGETYIYSLFSSFKGRDKTIVTLAYYSEVAKQFILV